MATQLPFLEGTLAFVGAVYVLENYIRLRQYRRLSSPRPAVLSDDIVSTEQYQSACSYESDKLSFAFLHDAFETAKTVAILVFGILPILWQFAGETLESFGYDRTFEVSQSLVFMFGMSLVETLIDLPFSLYKVFVIEENHGFNKQTYRLFFTDLVKSQFFMIVLGAPLGAAFLHLIKWGGEHFYLYVIAFQLVVQVVMASIYPSLIQPCFNKVTPLPEGSLRTRIEQLAGSLSYPLKKLYEIDGSARSSHSNAYQYGFCNNKHIVIYDTLLKSSSEEEVEAIVAHELGHWSLSHVLKFLLISCTNSFITMFLYGYALHYQPLFSAFGFGNDESYQPTLIGLLLASYITSPLSHVISFAVHALSRRFEFQADEFAAKLGYGANLRAGLIKLQRENKGSYNPDPLYSAYHYSHPPLIERLAALVEVEKSVPAKPVNKQD